MEEKFAELDTLLEKTAVYSQFLADRLNERVAEKDHVTEEGNTVEKDVKEKKRKRTGRVKGGAKRLKALVEDAEEADMDVNRKEVKSSGFSQPSTLTGATMRGYQLAGVEWLVSLYENGINGILADEMGLGKTIQAIGFLAYLRERGVSGPFLIVGPLSVVTNWVNEVKRFTPSMPVKLYYGAPDERKSIRAKLPKTINEKYPLIITTYEMIIRDRKYLSQIPWKYIVIDEAHRIKNFECKLLQELKSYSSANRLLLTGTPLQNNLTELWSLLNFLLPEVFDDLSAFQSWFDFDSTGDVGQEALLREKEGRVVSKLHNILRPFLLRRVKTDVEQILPSKKEIVLYTPLTDIQEKYYNAARDGRIRDVISVKKGRSQSNHMLNVLMQMRKACAHPYLFEELDEVGMESSETTEQMVTCASKLLLIDRLLKRLFARGHKVLLFSQFTTMLDILEDFMGMRDYKYCRIDGDTKLDDRIRQMQDFNDPESEYRLFMLSTRAGGLGINLIGADTVIFHDSDLNPQMDLQAMDRCHRIGQTKPVHVYRLVCSNTVEEALLERAKEKRKLERVVVTKGRFHRLRYETSKAKLDADGLQDIIGYNPAEEFGQKKKPISDEELDKVIAMRPGPRDATESISSKVTDETSLQGDGFEVFDLDPVQDYVNAD